MFEILIDTGGTFTDGVLVGSGASVCVAKSETDPSNPERGILSIIENLAGELNIAREALLPARDSGAGVWAPLGSRN